MTGQAGPLSRPLGGEGQDTEWLRVLSRSSPVGIFRTALDGQWTFVNDRWCVLAGRPAEAGIGMGWLQAVHPDDRHQVEQDWKLLSVPARSSFRSEHRYFRPDGTSIWVLCEAVAERMGDGRVVGYVGTVADISGLRRIQEDLRQMCGRLDIGAERRSARIQSAEWVLSACDEAIVISDWAGSITGWNGAARRMFGYSEDEILGKTSLILTPEELKGEALKLKAKIRNGEAIEQIETVRLAKGGRRLEVALSAFALHDEQGKVTGTVGMVRDIGSRKKAERELRRLSWRLLRTQDEERRRIARELHDSTAQTVAALAINLSVLSDSWQIPEDPKHAALLANCRTLAEEAARDLRTQSYLLHPPFLDERGLASALRWYVEGFAARSGIRVDLEIPDGPERFGRHCETAIFRIIQESLSNVHRHSKSAAALVRVRLEGGTIEVEIRDWGCGLRAPDEGRGVGIPGMRERLSQLGGSLRIETGPAGTAVYATLPRIL